MSGNRSKHHESAPTGVWVASILVSMLFVIGLVGF